MNLSFDLQLFTETSVASGVKYGDKTFYVENVTLSEAFSSSDTVAGFKFTSTNETGLNVATAGTKPATDDIVFFRAATGKNPTVIGVQDNGSYTWDLTTTLTAAELGKDSKIRLWNMGSNPEITLAAAGGQSIELAGGNLTVKATSKTASDGELAKAVVLKGGVGNVSLLTGSSVQGASVSGGAGAAISLTAGNDANNIFNLGGSDAEAFVNFAAAGSTIVSSKVEGFSKIVYKGGAQADSLEINGIKNSAVSINGNAGNDSITFGTDVKGFRSITVDGGTGENKVTLSGTGNEIVVMADQVAGTKNEVTKWTESNGDKDKGNTISLAGSMDTFLVGTVSGGKAEIAASSVDGATFDTATGTTLDSSNGRSNLSVNIMASDDTYSALLFGSTALASTQGIKFDDYDYMIADTNHTLNLGSTNKKIVVLANTLDEHHWGSTNVYKNVTTIASSSAGGSLIINGVDSIAAKITANGKNDSIWGGNNTLADTIVLSTKDNINVFSGANDGLDVINNYAFSTTLAKSSVIRFLDGVEYVSAENGTLTIGKDDANAAVINFTNSTTAGGKKLAYAFGAEGEKYVAVVDTSTNGSGSISYDSLASVYIGQGDSTVSVGSAAKDVKLGWDGGAGYIGIAAINGTMAADGAVIVGVAGTEQTIQGSSRGASSISGGFVADEWTDTKSDVLIGGGVDTRSTTFFVGKDMGRDEIQKLSGKDNIVFLGTKYSDLDNFKYDASDTGFVFKFGSNTVTADVGTNKKLSNIKDVSLYFDDGTYVWDGAELTKAE